MSDTHALAETSLATTLAESAVRVQSDLDEAWQRNVEAALPAYATLLRSLGADALSMLPARNVVSRFEVETRVRVESRRSASGSLRLVPLNIAYERRYERVNANAHRISIVVEQIPLPEPIAEPRSKP